MVEPFLWLALVVRGWRWLTRTRSPTGLGPMPSVDDAPPNAEPVFRPRLEDNGLATYSLAPPDRPARAARDAGR